MAKRAKKSKTVSYIVGLVVEPDRDVAEIMLGMMRTSAVPRAEIYRLDERGNVRRVKPDGRTVLLGRQLGGGSSHKTRQEPHP